MPHEPRHASIARCVSRASMSSPLRKSHSLSMIRTRESPIPATSCRVSSSDLPTLTTTSSQTSSTEAIAATMGKLSWTALRTSVNPDSNSGPELQIVQPAIQAVRREQVAMRPALHDPPLRQDDDEIGVLHRREPVGDHEHRTMRHQPLDRFLHEALGLSVERTGGLVEDQDRWIAQQRAGNRDPLPLPAAEPGATLAEQCAVTFRQPHDEVRSEEHTSELQSPCNLVCRLLLEK